MSKTRVLFVSDLVVPTGFSTVAHNIIKNIQDDFEITGLGVNYRGDPHPYTFPIYPASTGPSMNIYGIDRLCNIVNSGAVDIVYILNDAWVISYYLDALKKNCQKLPKIVVYFPVDSYGHDTGWYRDFDIVTKAFTYTNFGKLVVKEARPEIEVGIIPHGVDTSVFYKINATKLELRKSLFGTSGDAISNLGELFIVLNANRNQPRKKLDIGIKGFAKFAQNKPDVRLYMHCGIRDSSIDVGHIARRYGIEDKLIITSMAQGIQRVDSDKLNIIYNACDVGINTSMGEGWGLTNVEHAVTGAVQVVPNHSSCAELFNDCGLLMEPIIDFTFDNSQTIGQLTSASEVARCLETLYNNRNLTQSLGEKGMNKFSAVEYQWYTIAQQWRQVFKEVASDNSNSTISTALSI